MILSPNEIEELLSIIDRYTLIFISHKIGTNVLNNQQLETLNSFGIKPEGVSTVAQAFQFGILSTVLNEPTLHSLTFDQLKDRVKNNKLISPLNAMERAALENLQFQTYNGISKLANDVKSDIKDALVFADKQNHTVLHSKLVTDAVRDTIEQRKGVKQIVSIIGEKTGEWNRDLGKVSSFVLHQALDEGKATGIERKLGPDALVYKDTRPNVCKHCTRLYIKNNQPIIFKLSVLKANGTNIGRKVDEWKAIVGPTHVYCRCSLRDTPSGFTIDGLESGLWFWNGKDFEMDKTKWVRKVDRKSKITVTVDGVETII